MKLSWSIIPVALMVIAHNAVNEKKAATSKNIVTVADNTPVSASRLIIPGKSIGLTSINLKHAKAMKNLGKPANTEGAMGGKELATWYSKPVIHGSDTVINEIEIFFTTQMGIENESRVSHIRITSSFFTTAQHTGTGSHMDMIRKYFPNLKEIATYTSLKTKRQVFIYDDNKKGIAFEMDNGVCVGITVHKPGDQAYETYNALFGDVNYL